MIIRKTERIYNEGKKKWFKHGSFDKEITYQTVKRTTVWLLFIPIFYSETILKTENDTSINSVFNSFRITLEIK